MNIMLVLIPLSLLLVIAAAYAFFWAVDNGQFENLDTPALDMLIDDDVPASGSRSGTPTDGAGPG